MNVQLFPRRLYEKTLSLLALSTLLSTPALALEVDLGGIGKNDKIPPNFAFCQPDGQGKTKNGGNINPQVRWSGAPKDTKSYALLVVDTDVPQSFEDANQEGKVLGEGMARRDFYHWVLVDIPATTTSHQARTGQLLAQRHRQAVRPHQIRHERPERFREFHERQLRWL